jgi:hypothetical protein
VGSSIRAVSGENEAGELRVGHDGVAAARRSRAERRSQAGWRSSVAGSRDRNCRVHVSREGRRRAPVPRSSTATNSLSHARPALTSTSSGLRQRRCRAADTIRDQGEQPENTKVAPILHHRAHARGETSRNSAPNLHGLDHITDQLDHTAGSYGAIPRNIGEIY